MQKAWTPPKRWVFLVATLLGLFSTAQAYRLTSLNPKAHVDGIEIGSMLILNLTLWFVLHVLFANVEEMRAGPMRWYAFDPLSLDLKAAALAVIAAVLAFRFHRGLIQMVAIMAALGVAVRLLLGPT